MTAHVSDGLKALVRSDAGERCGYCLSSERWLGIAHEIEHIVPRSVGGLTIRENLWLACRRCNSFKSDRIKATDPQAGESVSLFHPRNARWTDHFQWSLEGTRIIGLSPIGRATVDALQLNHALVVITRSLWVRAGVHPPGM